LKRLNWSVNTLIGRILFYMDALDYTIVEILSENAKLGTKEVAEQIGLTVTPTYERIKRLEKSGVIAGYKAEVNHRLLGKMLHVHCYVTLNAHERSVIDNFEEKVVKLNEVEQAYHLAGEVDYVLVIRVEDMDHYHEFIKNRLSAIDQIGNVKSNFVMRTIK